MKHDKKAFHQNGGRLLSCLRNRCIIC